MILTLFNTTLLSLKTSKKQKIVQCADLTSLAKELGTKRFTSVEFPLEVYMYGRGFASSDLVYTVTDIVDSLMYSENAKIEKEIRLPEGDETKPNALFGVELDKVRSNETHAHQTLV